jgi:hypothetical protein
VTLVGAGPLRCRIGFGDELWGDFAGRAHASPRARDPENRGHVRAPNPSPVGPYDRNTRRS